MEFTQKEVPRKTPSVGKILTAVIEAMKTDESFFLQFLCTAASNDEETLVNQLLILAQEPKAQIIADREDWENIGCWVSEVSYMALLDEENGYEMYPAWTEKQVSVGNGDIPKWTLNLLYERHIAQAVHKNSDTLECALREMIQSEMRRSEIERIYEVYRTSTGRNPEYESNYFEREYGYFAYIDNEDDVRDFSKTNAELEMEWLQQFIQNAVHFQLMLRCGLNPFGHYKAEDFRMRDEYAKSHGGFLVLLSEIYQKTKQYMAYMQSIAKQFPDQLPYQNAQLVSPRRIAEELGVENGGAIRFPYSGASFSGYDERRLEYLKNYAYHEYLTELMEDSLASSVTSYGENIREDAKRIRENKVAQRKAAGMTAEQIEAEKAMIDMEINEILRDKYFYC